MTNDKEQLIALKKGNHTAFRYFVDTYTKGLHHYAMRICMDDMMSDDVLQHCFIKLWQSPPLFLRNNSIKSWLYKIAYHYMMDSFRRDTKYQSIDNDNNEADDYSVTLEPALIDKIEVEQLLATLNIEQRTIMYHYYFDGYNVKEIANILHINARACESSLRRAKNKLHHMYQEPQYAS